jgi:hypothetical protein
MTRRMLLGVKQRDESLRVSNVARLARINGQRHDDSFAHEHGRTAASLA